MENGITKMVIRFTPLDNYKINKSESPILPYGVKHYKTKACRGCALRDRCTKNKNGRLIERNYYQPDLEANKDRVEANPDYYRQRQQITEHQFGTLKRQWHFTHTLLRGKEKVLTEVYLNFSVYNLIRCIQILGIKELKSKLRQLVSIILTQLEVIRAILSSYFRKIKPDSIPL